MSVMARYINRLSELQSELVAAETQYQEAVGRVVQIQKADGVGQFMYIPAGGSPIPLTGPTPEAYKTLLDDLTKASVNSVVSHIAKLWETVGELAVEVGLHIASAEAKAAVAATVSVETRELPPKPTGVSTAVASSLGNALENAANEVPPYPAQPTTVAVPPRVRRIPGITGGG